jgi:DNA-binding response OmpR family regulator
MKILIIEDDKPTVHLLSIILKKYLPQSQIQTVSQGLLARKILASENFDLIICDLALPEVDGITLMSEYRENGGKAITIAYTGRDKFKGGDIFDLVILKPFNAWKKLLEQLGLIAT